MLPAQLARILPVIKVRGGRGLGDALYVRVVAEHLVKTTGKPIIALSGYTDVFIGSGAKVAPFNRNGGHVVAHYVYGKANPRTTQWQDVCRSAGVPDMPLRFEWGIRNRALVESLREKAAGRPLVVVHGGREPMDRKDGFGMELLPTKSAFDIVLDSLRDCFTVQIGKATQIYPLTAAMDLNGATTVSDLLDIASACDGVVCQCSFAIPLAEVFDKPLLAVWSAKAAKSQTAFIRHTTPAKLLSGHRDRFVMDDMTAHEIREVSREVFVAKDMEAA